MIQKDFLIHQNSIIALKSEVDGIFNVFIPTGIYMIKFSCKYISWKIEWMLI